eukprot:3872340-Rhodomonas_salina.5
MRYAVCDTRCAIRSGRYADTSVLQCACCCSSAREDECQPPYSWHTVFSGAEKECFRVWSGSAGVPRPSRCQVHAAFPAGEARYAPTH